jgi:hypothetical protein
VAFHEPENSSHFGSLAERTHERGLRCAGQAATQEHFKKNHRRSCCVSGAVFASKSIAIKLPRLALL